MPARVMDATSVEGLNTYLKSVTALVAVPVTLEAAVAAAKQYVPDLVFISAYLDGIRMTLPDGLSELRKALPAARIVLFVGSDPPDLPTLRAAGMADVEVVAGTLDTHTIDELLVGPLRPAGEASPEETMPAPPQRLPEPSAAPSPLEETPAHVLDVPPPIADLPKTATRLAFIRQHVVAFYGAKGGVGTTTLAVATALRAAQLGLSVGVLDWNFDNPNVHGHLPLPCPEGAAGPDPARTVLGIMPALTAGQITALNVWDLLLPGPAGVMVCPGPIYDPHRVQRLQAGHLADLMDLILASGRCDLLIIDTDREVAHAGTYTALTRASYICHVCNPSAIAVQDAGRKLRLLDDLQIPRRKHILLTNQHVDGLTAQAAIHESLDLSPIATIPFDNTHTPALALQSGRPLALSHPSHPIVSGADGLLRQLYPGLEPRPSRRQRVAEALATFWPGARGRAGA